MTTRQRRSLLLGLCGALLFFGIVGMVNGSSRSTGVTIFTYGSLLNTASAAKTLPPHVVATFRPARVHGLKRLFNRAIPEELIVPRFGPLADPQARGALNVIATGKDQDWVNGLAFEVSPEGLEALKEREVGYALIPVEIELYGEQVVKGYTFSAPLHTPATCTEITPIPGYAQLVYEGAMSHGEAFLREYLETTHLADGTTPLLHKK